MQNQTLSSWAWMDIKNVEKIYFLPVGTSGR
jgi:hypothetical protein